MQTNKELIENELKEIKKYIENETEGQVVYEIKENDDQEEYIELVVNFKNKKEVIFRFDETDFCGAIKRKIKEEIKFHIEEYLKNLEK